MPTPGELALAEALRHEGVKETPPGSNDTPFGVWFGSNLRPWCGIFVSWAFHAGAGLIICDGFKGPGVIAGKGCAWVPTIRDWLVARGWFLGPHETPQAGDIVLYDWGLDGALDHVGIVAGHVALPTFTAIEGNGCAWVPSVQQWLQARGWWHAPHETPEPGDLVLYDWGLDGSPDHIGIIESAAGGKLSTIEGNVYSAVCRMTRYTAHVAGYGRIGG